MAKKFAILNFKGGVGKTTTAVNLGDAIHLLGKKVLLVDIDEQRNATIILDKEKEVDDTLYDALTAKTIGACQIYEHSKGFDYIASDKRMSNIEAALSNMHVGKETLIKRLLTAVEGEYDYIIIDCPPNRGLLTINAMMASDELIVPIDSQVMALDGLSDITDIYEEVKTVNTGLSIGGFLLTRFKSNLNTSKTVYNALRDAFPDKLFNARIRENTTISQAPGSRSTIFEYDRNCAGAEDYLQLAREITGIKRKKI